MMACKTISSSEISCPMASFLRPASLLFWGHRDVNDRSDAEDGVA